ncbi:MAG: hypothetical protein LBI49_07560 [Nocardiopsaceae bacterium]|jgi:transcriptional regulator with XRE-family HTH domain|nr:hypothetical protein [Nocardiopsaceae bacterium]
MKSTQLPFEVLREQAIALRQAGKSRRQIKEILRIGSNATLNQALSGEPPPTWTRRPRAKDHLRLKARELREQGSDYDDIVSELGVSKSTVSAWVSDLPWPERLSYEECRKRATEGVRRYWEAERPAREGRLEAISSAATARIGELSDREVLIAGAIAYWCEGAKNKPYRKSNRVSFINSDPDLILFFLKFLDVAGVARNRLTYRLQIHENAQVQAAERFWLIMTGAEHHQFLKPVLKRHNPKTVRKNSGDDYRGCLRIDVQRSSHLYRQIEGWARAAMATESPNPTAVPE